MSAQTSRRPLLAAILCIGCALLLAVPLGRSAAQTGILPTITLQPKTQGVLIGQRATLTVQATNATSYQWYIGSSGDDSIPIVNATSNMYITEPVVATYRYWVRVSNAYGSVDSETARIDLEEEKPGIYTTRLPTVWRAGPAIPFVRAK